MKDSVDTVGVDTWGIDDLTLSMPLFGIRLMQ